MHPSSACYIIDNLKSNLWTAPKTSKHGQFWFNIDIKHALGQLCHIIWRKHGWPSDVEHYDNNLSVSHLLSLHLSSSVSVPHLSFSGCWWGRTVLTGPPRPTGQEWALDAPHLPPSTGQRRVVIETHHLRLKIWTEYMCDSSSVSLCSLATEKLGHHWTLILALTFTHTDRWVAKVFRVAARWLLTSTFHKDPKSLCTRISPSMPFGSFMIHQVKIVHLL